MARLQKRSPIEQLRELEEQMEELFSSSFPGFSREGNGESLQAPRWSPDVDIFEEDDQIVVECECPGMERDNIDVSLEDHVLTITGQREREEEVDEDDFYRSERSFDTFKRSFRLPSDIDEGAVNATYVDGVLTVSCPMNETETSTSIEIT
jgi:HSP20 family protein